MFFFIFLMISPCYKQKIEYKHLLVPKIVKMKMIYSLCLTIIFASNVCTYGQISILFVDDSDDGFMNAELFYSAFDSVGFPATYYNAVDSAAGPSESVMSNFDLVVWHPSTQSINLALWNKSDEDNNALKTYLEGGGRLWLVGNDFLLDRYGAPPVTFDSNDFPNKYLGIVSHDVETYNDDGNLGVPIVIPDTNSVIANLNNLTWQFATLWYVDGVSLNENALPIYRMGDANYLFADSIAAVYHDNGTFQVLSYFFDISLVNNFDNLKQNVLSVLAFFNNLITDNSEVVVSQFDSKLYPNPTSSQINIEISIKKSAYVSVSLTDLYGRTVLELMRRQWFDSGKRILSTDCTADLENGYYFIKMDVNDESTLKPIIIQK